MLHRYESCIGHHYSSAYVLCLPTMYFLVMCISGGALPLPPSGTFSRLIPVETKMGPPFVQFAKTVSSVKIWTPNSIFAKLKIHTHSIYIALFTPGLCCQPAWVYSRSAVTLTAIEPSRWHAITDNPCYSNTWVGDVLCLGEIPWRNWRKYEMFRVCCGPYTATLSGLFGSPGDQGDT